MSIYPKRDDIYRALEINPSADKNKKATVAFTMWKKTNEASSSMAMFSLFPELVRSPNIIAVIPSKKALNRLGLSKRNCIPLPLDRSMQFEWKFDTLVRTNLGTITKGLLEISSGYHKPASSMHDKPASRTIVDDSITVEQMRNFLQSDITSI